MITMSNLGKNGRLGNQLFQFAFLFGLSKARGYDFCIPPNTDLLNCFDIPVNIGIFNNKKQREKHFNFDCQFPSSYDDNTDYSGYYQSEKYFSHCKKDLMDVLQFKSEWKIPLEQDAKDLVSVHIRRGDYVGNKFYHDNSGHYINQAKKEFIGKKFIVFSDDINWCKDNNIGDYYAEGNSHYTDLYQMSECSGSIIANSSFSWWGAYLKPKHRVIAPKNWFTDRKNDTDVYCEEWILK